MPYAARADLGLDESLLTWLTRGEGLGAPDESAIADALDRASRLIDQHIGQRYTLPYPDADGTLRDYCAALARLGLYRLRPDGPEVPQMIADAAAEARRDLKDIAAGRLSLFSSDPIDRPSEPGKVFIISAGRMLGRDLLSRW